MRTILLSGITYARLYLGDDLHWDGTRLDNRDDGIEEDPSVYADEVRVPIKVEPNLSNQSSYLWINHLYSAPESKTHHYFLDTGDCLLF